MRKKAIVAIGMVAALVIFTGCQKNENNVVDKTAEYSTKTDVNEMTKEELLTLAKAYEANNDLQNARKTLVVMHKLYPDNSNLELISNIPVECDDSNAILLCEMALMDVDDANITDIRNIISGEEFASYFKDEIVGVTRKTLLNENGRTIEVEYDDFAIVLKATDADSKYREIKITNIYGQVLACNSLNGLYEGDFLSIKYDPDGKEQEKYLGTFKNGQLTGSLQITTSDEVYFGSFDENGNSVLPQISSETAQGHIIYAYNKNMTKYLYMNLGEKLF